MTTSPPPLYENIAGEDGKATLPYALFFEQSFNGDSGNSWTPNFVNLTTVGTPTITARYYKISQYICYFSVTITPATSTTSTAGTTYIDNFPLRFSANGICFAVTGNLGSNAGMCVQSDNRIYVPSWSAVTVPLTIVGLAEAR